jgi:hypothetical protein
VPVSDADEALHPVESTDPEWSDSLYFNAWDPASGVFLMTRMAVKLNRPLVTAGFVAWHHGAVHPASTYSHRIDDLPPSNWDVMTIGALGYRMEQAGRRWTVGLDRRAHLTFDAISGCLDYNDGPVPTPRPWAWGHYEQLCRVTGDLVLQGALGEERIAFDGVGIRDHSWGVRDWAAMREWHWVAGYSASGAIGFNAFTCLMPDSTVTAHGFVHRDGEDDLVVGVEADTIDAPPSSTRLVLTTASGATVRVQGRSAAAPLAVRPVEHSSEADVSTVDATIVHEVPMEMIIDGRAGFGIYEMLVNP